MATLEKIRNKAGLLVTIVGLALFAFIIGDLLNSSSSFINRNQNHVLEVNGEAVDYQEYNSRETELTEVYKMLMGQPNMSDAYMARIRDDVYNEIVLDKVLAPRLESLGITVTDDEMLDMTQGENLSPLIPQFLPFLQNQETGQFDRNALANFLYQLKTMDQYPPEQKEQLKTYMGLWLFCEKNIKRNRLNEKYTALLSKAVAVNSLEAKDAFESKKESSDIVFTMKSFAGIPDSTIQVSQAEIEKLYNERKEMFRQLETVIIDYIAVDIVPSQEDYDKAQKEMNEIRAELETTDNVAALTNEKSDRKYVNAFFSRNSFASDPDLTSYVETAAVGAIEGPIFKDNTYRLLKLVDKTVAPDSVHVFVLSLAPRATEAETRIYADSLLATIQTDDDFNAAIQAHSVDQFKEKGGEFGWLTEAA
ncbi:MAG: SurA N-terminal domain-containing protein, partial [Tannerella sp.]|nr:SurA N-terminal domain-containing protein [Tannerella sp.]